MAAPAPWLDYWRRRHRRALRLFCCHHAGGSALLFRDWHRFVPDTIEICPIQLPGRGKRLNEPGIADLVAISTLVADTVESVADGPFALFGYSMGAYLAFETTLRLADHGLAPRILFLAGAAAPHARVDRSSTWHLPRAQLIEKLSSMNATPREVLENDELMDLLLPVIRIDLRATETYVTRPGTKVSVPLVTFAGTEDAEASGSTVAAWADWSSGSCANHLVAGNHGFAMSRQKELAGCVASHLAAWDRPDGSHRVPDGTDGVPTCEREA